MKSLALNNSKSLFLSNIYSIPLLTKEEKYDLAVKYYEDKDIDAVNKLVVSNMKFVVKIASEYKSYGFPLVDLVQEEAIGLMCAVKKFDPYKGYKLISYAVWWIRAKIHSHIMKFWSNVKIGTTQAQRKLFHKFQSAKKRLKLSGEHTSGENTAQLAKHFGVKECDIEEMKTRMSSRDSSLDSPLGNEGNTTYKDLLQDKLPDHEKLLFNFQTERIKSDAISKCLNQLNKRETKIINDRYFCEKKNIKGNWKRTKYF